MTRPGTCALLLALFALALASPPPSAAADRGEQAFQENCSLCHTLDRVRAKHLTRDEWQQMIERMVGFGCPIVSSKKAQVAVLEYMSKAQGPVATASVALPAAGQSGASTAG